MARDRDGLLDPAERDRLRPDRHSPEDRNRLTAVAFALASAALFGLMSVVIRIGLRRGGSAEVGSLVAAVTAVVTTFAIAAVAAVSTGDVHVSDLWPFVLAGVLAPGLAQLFFFRAIRDVGASRTSVVVGAGPLIAVAIALIALHEPARPAPVVAALAIVARTVALVLDPEPPSGFRSRRTFCALLA